MSVIDTRLVEADKIDAVIAKSKNPQMAKELFAKKMVLLDGVKTEMDRLFSLCKPWTPPSA